MSEREQMQAIALQHLSLEAEALGHASLVVHLKMVQRVQEAQLRRETASASLRDLLSKHVHCPVSLS